jgi:hypothetical protein
MRKRGACTLPFRYGQQAFIPKALRMTSWNIIRDLNRTSNFQRPTRRASDSSFEVKCSMLEVRRFL